MSKPSKDERDLFLDEANELVGYLEANHCCAQDVVSVLGIALVTVLSGAPNDMRADAVEDVVSQIRTEVERLGPIVDKVRELRTLKEYSPSSGYDA